MLEGQQQGPSDSDQLSGHNHCACCTLMLVPACTYHSSHLIRYASPGIQTSKFRNAAADGLRGHKVYKFQVRV
jgi:hypothetical protein